MYLESQLIRRSQAACGTAIGRLIALHGDGDDVATLLPFSALAAPHLEVHALQAPRSRNPLLGSGHGAASAWGSYVGYDWYRQDATGRPEPASFGDSLWQIEQAARALRDARLLYLFGHRQGGTLALALATLAPDLFDGVIAVACDPPPSMAAAVPAGRGTLPVLWLRDPRRASSRIERTGLTDARFRIAVREVPGSAQQPAAAASTVATWLEEVSHGCH